MGKRKSEINEKAEIKKEQKREESESNNWREEFEAIQGKRFWERNLRRERERRKKKGVERGSKASRQLQRPRKEPATMRERKD